MQESIVLSRELCVQRHGSMRKHGTIKTVKIQHSLRLVRGEAESGGQGPDQQKKSPQSKEKDQGLRDQVLNRE